MKKYLLLLYLLLFLSALLPAQLPGNHLQILSSVPVTMTVCGSESAFSVTFTNVSGGSIDSLAYNPLMPAGMEFVGIQSSGWTVINPLPANAPTMRYNGSLPAGNSIVLYFSARASCALATSIADSIGSDTLLNGDRADYQVAGQPFYAAALGSQSYNVVTPRLNIALVTAPTQTLHVGDTVRHRIQVNNTGLGAVDSMRIHIHVEGELDWVSAADNSGSMSFMVGGLPGNRLLTCADNNGFQPNESVEFVLTFLVARCSPASNTNYTVQWGCTGDVCNLGASNSTTSSNVSVPMLNGNVTAVYTSVLDQGNYCSDSLATIRSGFANHGPGTAFSLNLDLGASSYLGTPVSVSLLQAQLLPPIISGSVVGCFQNFGCPAAYLTLHLDSLMNDPDGLGGLADLDGDGSYDDLAPGDTFFVDLTLNLKTGPSCFYFANICDFSAHEWYVAHRVRFNNACGIGNGLGTCGGNWPFFSGFYGKQANGPTDLIPGDTAILQFMHSRQDQFNYAWGGLWDCSLDSFMAVFTLPSGLDLAGDSAWFGYTNNLNMASPKRVTRIGNQVIVPGVHYMANAPVSTYFFLPVLATCPQSGQRTLQIDWEVQYVCDTSCNCPLRLACGVLDVVVHCPGTSCNGFVNHGMWMRRSSFGWTDYTRMTYANAQTPDVKLDRVYPCDSIAFRAAATVGGGLPFDSARLRLSYPVQFNDPLVAFQSGQFVVNGMPCGGMVTANMVTLATTGINPTRYTLEIPIPLPCLNTLVPGDSLVFDGTFKTGGLNVPNLPRDFQIDQFRAGMYAIDTLGDTLGCDDWGARLYTLKPQTYPLAPSPILNVYCSGASVYHYNHFWNGSHPQSNSDFLIGSNGLEYRPHTEIGDTIRVLIPNTFEVTPNSALLYTGMFVQGQTTQFPTTTHVIHGSTHDEWQFVHPSWNAQGGGFTHWPFHPAVQYFRFDIRPKSCDALLGINDSITFIQDLTLNAYTSDSACHIQERSVLKRQMQYFPPHLSLDPGNVIQDGKQRTTSWLVQVCNFPPPLANHGPADSIWISLGSNNLDLRVTEVFDNVHGQFMPIDSISTGLVWVRYPYAILTGGCAEFKVTAEYTHCIQNALDTIAVAAGPICGPMPMHPDSAACVLHADLVIRYKNADLQMFVSHGPATPFEFCNDFPIELLLKSSGLGSMYAVGAEVTMPTGMDLVPGSFEYAFPSTGAFQPLAPPTLLSGNYHWDLSGLVFSHMGQDTGFTGITDTLHNQIKVRFRLRPNCDFVPGSQIAVAARGETNCQSTIHIAPYLTPPLVPMGFPNPGTFDVEIAAEGITCTDTTAIVDVLIVNTSGRSTTASDFIVVTLDTGMAYDSGFLGMHNPPMPSSMITSGSDLQWPMTLGIAPGDSVWFRFRVHLGSEFCRNWNLFAQTNFAAIMSCPDTVCTLLSVTGYGTDTDSLCCCNSTARPFHSDAIIDSLRYACDASGIHGTVRICNRGNMPISPSTVYAWYAGDPGQSSAPQLLGTDTLGASVPPGGCVTRPFSMPRGIDSVFVVVNDLGQGPFPYDFGAELPHNQSGECDFLNNVTSSELDCICDSLNVHALFMMSVNGPIVTLQDTSTGPVSVIHWILNDSMVPGLPGETRTFTFDSIGTYPICLVAIANGSCPHSQSSSAYCCSDTFCMTVLIDSCALFQANFGYVVQNALGASVAFTDQSTPFPGTVTTWSFGDGDSASTVPGQTIVHQYPQFGNYTVVVTSMVLLQDHLCCRSVYSEVIRVRRVYLFPNPAHDQVTVRYELPAGMMVNVAIVDASGKVLTEVIGDEDGIETFPLEGLRAGVYLVRVTTAAEVWGAEFVKE